VKKIKQYSAQLLIVICSCCIFQISVAQKKFNDSIYLSEMVVTATRTTKSIGDIPVPVQVISKKYIQQTGSQKLIDILQQQTGLVLADNPLGQALQGYPNPFGSGIQLQGLDPAYTLILLDGEPLTGRNAGILNLGRVAIGNIKQIEIIKGPTASLYGNDALAGVINIITEKPKIIIPAFNCTMLQMVH
jgi:outer membrane receptor for ferrienterochelin and colicins